MPGTAWETGCAAGAFGWGRALPVPQRNGAPGGEFTYVISSDRRSAFAFKIFVTQSALKAWAKVNGRALTSSEEYAVAKMRLFQAFDEGSVKPAPEGQQPGEVIVDESNLEEMLGRLGI